ncbi:hypothetical protein ACFE04_000637 [Oxalis oulophora]
MASTQTIFFKENTTSNNNNNNNNENSQIGQSLFAHQSSSSSSAWWTSIGSGHQHDNKHSSSSSNTTTHFTIFPDHSKIDGDGLKPFAPISPQSALPDYQSRFDLGFGQSLICAKYPYAEQYYGLFSAYGAQLSGRIMLPVNLLNDDLPIYVNAKQYNGIMRRRKSRAKAVLQNKLTKRQKPYMHYSRHLHAKRRPRGCGGRFLNTKSDNSEMDGINMILKKGEDKLLSHSQPAGSQCSEVLEPDGGTLNLPKGNGVNFSANGLQLQIIVAVTLKFDSGEHMGVSVLSYGHRALIPAASKWRSSFWPFGCHRQLILGSTNQVSYLFNSCNKCLSLCIYLELLLETNKEEKQEY